MSDIEVEPVDEIDVDEAGGAGLPERVDAPEYVLYGGKGGVGKTTMAAATALASAAAGTATLVVSTDPAHSLSDTLGVAVPPEPTELREDLYAAEIDPEAAMEEGVFDGEGDPLGGVGQLGDLLGDEAGDDGAASPLDPTLGGTAPGADEAAAMRQLLEYLDDPRFDRVVVDTAPTGHTLRLLQLPETLDSMVGTVLQLRERFSGRLQAVGGLFGGDDDPGEQPPGLDELRERIERLRAVLRDPAKTDFRVVMIPEEMSVVESERLVERLDEFGIPVNTLVVNRVMEDLASVAGDGAVGETAGDGAVGETAGDAERGSADGDAGETAGDASGGPTVGDEWIVSPSHESCEFCRRRWEVQQTALRRATELFRGRDVRRVPLLAEEVRGAEALRVVAACLGE